MTNNNYEQVAGKHDQNKSDLENEKQQKQPQARSADQREESCPATENCSEPQTAQRAADKEQDTATAEALAQDRSCVDAETAENEAAAESEENEGNAEAELMEALAELEDKHLRLTAEFDNFRKRSRKELEATYTRAKLDLTQDFLPLLDALDRAQESYRQLEVANKESLIEGMELLGKQASDCLKKIGITEIEALGQAFDPNLHAAVQHIEDENLGENVVAQVLIKGYKAGDAVVRHSVVIVAN